MVYLYRDGIVNISLRKQVGSCLVPALHLSTYRIPVKKIYFILFSLILLAACRTSRDYMSRLDDDKTLFDAVKAITKNASDSEAIKALPLVYERARDRHLQKIHGYESSTALSRWDKIIDEYNVLQKMYEAISESDAANRLVTVSNYQSTIYDLKQSAAEEHYREADALLATGTRADAKKAYTYFKKADKIVPGYKDAKSRMTEAFQSAIVNVQINPVTDNSFFFNSNWGNYGYNYSNEYFQQNLVRELGGQDATRYPARFYTEWEARRDNIQPDIVVNLLLRNMDIPRPSTQYYTRNSSARVEMGRDTSGNIIYQTVYARVNITRQYFTARAEMEVDITEVSTRKIISNNTYREEYSWQEEHASYSGDQRALSDRDWSLINNSRFNEPRQEEVLSELYRRLYPQVKNKISYAVDW